MLKAAFIGLLISTHALGSAAGQPSEYDDLICSYAWSCQTALRIAKCESTMRPWIIAGGNYGLFQINRIHASRFTINNDPNEFLDPTLNVQVAYTLYLERGWQPWVYCGPN